MTMAKRRKGQPAPGAVRIIAIANQKGGVGKTTTAVSLGACLAEQGQGVLVVDLDPQGNASTGLGIGHAGRDVTIYEVLATEAPVEGAIVRTPVEGLDAIPSTIDLAGAEIELVSLFSRESRLAKSLKPVMDGRYQFILLDCPPSLGLLTVNALVAAEELIVPIQCEYYALEGLGQLLRNVGLVQQNVNPSLRLTGIVMTMFDPRTKLSEQVVEEVRKYFGDQVYDTIIPRTVRLSEAPGYGEPITMYDPKSRGAETYRALAGEILDRPIPKGGKRIAMEDLPPAMASPATRPRPEKPTSLEEAAPEVASKVEATEPAVEATEPSVVEAGPAETPEAEAEVVEAEPAVTPGALEDEDFEEVGVRDGEAEPPRAVGEFVAEESQHDGVEDLREIEGIGAPPEKADVDEGHARKKKWRMFRKGGDA